jgi:hypothetical protein
MRPQAYGRRFLDFVKARPTREESANGGIINAFLQERFQTDNLFPLLWSSET